ncbi:MAG: S9 family peptidase [Planctomycetota bacterium]
MKMSHLVSISLLAISAGGASGLGSTPSTAGHPEDDVPLIPRDVLFGNPERANVGISPEGGMLSWLAPVDGVLNVWVAPIDDLDAAKAVTDDEYRGIRQYFWAWNGTHIVYLQDTGGDENFRAYSVNVATGERVSLTPMDGIRVQINQVSPRFPDEMIFGINDRNPQLHDLYRVNIVTGERSLLMENAGYAGFTLDDAYDVRFAVRFEGDGSLSYFEVEGNGAVSQTPYLEVPNGDTLTTGITGFNAAGDVMYLRDSRLGDTSALYSKNLATGETDLVFEHPKADVSGVMAHPTTYEIEAVSANYTRTEWTVLDEGVAADLAFLRTVENAEVNVTGRTKADDLWTIAYTLSDGPVKYYLYDRESQDARYLFSNRPSIEGLPLAEMEPVVIESRDGLSLVSYLTVPLQSDHDGDLRPDEPLPMVLLVHGGPWARDSWGYNGTHQWLANRGYAVLSVNYRGSTGFGKNFINAGNFEWAGKMHDDLIDAVDWAVAKGIADEDRVAIMGGSYGGYATLVGLTFTPDVFACGVDIVGPSNLRTLLETIPPYWAPVMKMFTTRVGDPTTEEGLALLEARSPLNFVEKIERPLLIGQGANDPRVKQSESDQIVEAMQAKGIPVTYVLFPDEGHGFARLENRTAFNAVAESFLSEHLGGRYEPIDGDLLDSTIEVPAGVGGVPGLADALPPAEADG